MPTSNGFGSQPLTRFYEMRNLSAHKWKGSAKLFDSLSIFLEIAFAKREKINDKIWSISMNCMRENSDHLSGWTRRRAQNSEFVIFALRRFCVKTKKKEKYERSKLRLKIIFGRVSSSNRTNKINLLILIYEQFSLAVINNDLTYQNTQTVVERKRFLGIVFTTVFSLHLCASLSPIVTEISTVVIADAFSQFLIHFIIFPRFCLLCTCFPLCFFDCRAMPHYKLRY